MTINRIVSCGKGAERIQYASDKSVQSAWNLVSLEPIGVAPIGLEWGTTYNKQELKSVPGIRNLYDDK